jgi:hypothetical protein
MRQMAKRIDELGAVYYADPHKAKTQLQESYSRFYKLTGDDMRGFVPLF